MNHYRITRRKFVQGTSAAATLLLTGTRASGKVIGANERIRVVVAGLNNRGQAHIDGLLSQQNVELAYVVDPDKNVLASTLKRLGEISDGKLTTRGVADIRETLEDKTVDAISIATPNHWHSLMTIWGAQAGKHVYVEKPMSHDVREGRIAVLAQQKYGVVVQHGTQRRSDAGVAGLHQLLKSGKLPRLKIAYGYCCKPRVGIGHKPLTTPPENLDWNLWKGPAAIDDYHDNLVHYKWHWFWETGNGDLNNQGTHQLDVARWAIDDDQTHPVRATAIGGRFQWDDQGVTPNTLFGMAEFPNGQFVMFNVRNVNYKGYQRQVFNEYYLEDGSVITGESSYQIRRPGSSKPEPLDVEPGNVTPGGNWGAFIAAVRANDPGMVNGDVVEAHHGCVLGHLMNNSYRLGKKVPFDVKSGKFGDNSDAAEHFGRLHDIMKNGVGVPEDGASYIAGPTLTFNPDSERFTGEHAEAANRLLKDKNNDGFSIPTESRI